MVHGQSPGQSILGGLTNEFRRQANADDSRDRADESTKRYRTDRAAGQRMGAPIRTPNRGGEAPLV